MQRPAAEPSPAQGRGAPRRATSTRFAARAAPSRRKSRAAYVEQYGEECWELDGLSPTVIADLIRTEIEAMIDVAKWRKEAAEQHNRALLGSGLEELGQGPVVR